ncbi:endonuclease/exonuclease/phosphatase family protein [Tellurirhabdus bombi]|uniref:endonuclease/exonuclease/phosphatase family protein n=1 Tax=Tellurirhabdus bombi TaxID=2907205 RepID=UPI001F476D4F|nr:endonuclease/exonuclease/phosphatase family protein [Tellurirhabdus bombi]
MRFLLTVFLVCNLLIGFAQQTPKPFLTLNVMSFNIRFNTTEDGLNAWPNRKEIAAKTVADYGVDIAGVQEALAGQIADLQDQLPNYSWIGVGREDGKAKGEFAPIFFKKSKFEIEKQGTFWLSETPEEVGSKGWDAAIMRVATYGIFRDKQSGTKLFVINTHFDHVGEQARQNSAKLLIRKINELSEGLPVILTGDFNTPETSPAVQTLTTDAAFKLTNSEKLSEEAHTGGTTTFNGFKTDQRGAAIDFIFVGPGIDVKRHDYLPIMKENIFVSDHWPVLSRLSIPVKL